MRYQLRIISGSLRGRKLTVVLDPKLRPLADRAREALFNILGDAVPGRPFFDVFAGSGAVGMEALSRGAGSTVFVERDPRSVGDIVQHLQKFGVADRGRVLQSDAYRWGDKGALPAEPANVFLGPPYEEFVNHPDAVHWLVEVVQKRLAPSSVLIVQSEKQFASEQLPLAEQWDVRHYGRTQLALWTKPLATQESAP
jgi:16S rRNA (guanine(966)-N(2))-methyltransferase RsmD